jgi:hypothetical protein
MVQPPTTEPRLSRADEVRIIAKIIKALARKHYPDAAFETMAEHGSAFNIDDVRFGPAYTGADGVTCPPYAMASFLIGSQEAVDSELMETSRRALARDLQRVFGNGVQDVRYEPSAGSMIFQNRCTGTACVYGQTDALYASMLKAMEQDSTLRFLLPGNVRRGV